MTEVLLADHRLLVQYGLQALLQDLPDLTLVDAVGDCGQLARLCRQLKPAVVLLNINLPELQLDQLLIQLASDATATSLLLLLDPGQEAQIDLHKLLQQGGVGAILSDEPNELLFDALRTMGQGKIWFSPRLLFMLIKRERKPSAQPNR